MKCNSYASSLSSIWSSRFSSPTCTCQRRLFTNTTLVVPFRSPPLFFGSFLHSSSLLISILTACFPHWFTFTAILRDLQLFATRDDYVCVCRRRWMRQVNNYTGPCLERREAKQKHRCAFLDRFQLRSDQTDNGSFSNSNLTMNSVIFNSKVILTRKSIISFISAKSYALNWREKKEIVLELYFMLLI